MKLKKTLSGVLAVTTLLLSSLSTFGSASAYSVETKDTPQVSSAAQSNNVSADSSSLTKDQIKNGAILHAWCWDFDTITTLMPEIAAAGYTAVQTSPVSGCYDKYPLMFLMGKNPDGTYDTTGRHGAWFWNYQPTEFSITNYQFGGSEAAAKYKTMCDAAHNNGVQIITDIVSNHTTAEKENGQYAVTKDYIDNVVGENMSYDANVIYHQGTYETPRTDKTQRIQMINYMNSDLPDVNTENDKYQDYLVRYLNTLIAAGCDGFRFDMAVNIGGIASDKTAFNDTYDFWDVVTGAKAQNNQRVGKTSEDGSNLRKTADELFYYGEILGNDDYNHLNEYGNYINVTNSQFGYDLRDRIKDSNLMLSSSSNDVISKWSSHPLRSSNKMITWVESHDTYLNDHNSAWMEDWQIRACWAVVAARKDGTPLFFSRPKGSNGAEGDYWGENILGQEGNDQFNAPEVSAVNHFRTAMCGQDETLRNPYGNKKLLQIDRGTKGTCIINISEYDYDIDTITSLAVGEYYDDVTGSMFTVYTSGGNNYIKGRVFAQSVATIYKTAEADISAAGFTSVFTDTTNATISLTNVSQGSYNIIADDTIIEEGEISNNSIITIGSQSELNSQYSSKKIKLILSAIDSNQVKIQRIYSLVKLNSNDTKTVYFDNSSYNWSSVYAYVYVDDTIKNAAYPGVAMTKIAGTNTYKYDVPYNLRNGSVIFSQNGDNTNRYPADGQPGLAINGRDMTFDVNYSWEEYYSTSSDVTQDGKQDVSSYNYIYFLNYSDWTDENIRVNMWNDAVGEKNGLRNQTMSYSEDLHCYYFKYNASLNFDNIKFFDGSDSTNTTSTVTAQPGKVYVPELNGWYSLSDIKIHNVYLKKKDVWNSANAYLWQTDGTVKNAEWPGKPMSAVGNSYFVYSYFTVNNYPAYDKIIFNRTASSGTKYQTENLTLPDDQNGEINYFIPNDMETNKTKCNGSWSTPSSSKTVNIILHYSDYKLAQKTDTSSSVKNAYEITLNNNTVTDGSLEKTITNAVQKFNMKNQYDEFVFHASQSDYVKSIASTEDSTKVGGIYAAKINPIYFSHQSELFSGTYTDMNSLIGTMSNAKWVTYKNGSNAVDEEDILPDLSNITSVEIYCYSSPKSYKVSFHYPKSDMNLTALGTKGLYTSVNSFCSSDPKECYYNQLLNPDEESLITGMADLTNYKFDGWYLIDGSTYLKVSSDREYGCRVTSNMELYAVYKLKSNTDTITSNASAMANSVDVYTPDSSTLSVKYRFNTVINIYDVSNNNSVTDVGVVYVKLNNPTDISTIRTNIAKDNFLSNINTSLSGNDKKGTGSTAYGQNSTSYNYYKYSTSDDVKLTNNKVHPYVKTKNQKL